MIFLSQYESHLFSLPPGCLGWHVLHARPFDRVFPVQLAGRPLRPQAVGLPLRPGRGRGQSGRRDAQRILVLFGREVRAIAVKLDEGYKRKCL